MWSQVPHSCASAGGSGVWTVTEDKGQSSVPVTGCGLQGWQQTLAEGAQGDGVSVSSRHTCRPLGTWVEDHSVHHAAPNAREKACLL
jgi:hypothetical protein